MKNLFIPFLIVCILFFQPVFLVRGQDVGDPAPDFSLSTLSGPSFTLSEHRGEVVCIFLFGYACPHCLANGYNTETGIYDVFKTHQDFTAVGVDTWDGNASGVESFKSSTGITYPLCLMASSLESLYKISYDRLIVVDKEGIIRYRTSSNSISAVVSNVAGAIEDIFKADTMAMGTGLRPGPETGLKIYPVPAADHIYVQSPSLDLSRARISIINSIGKVLLDEKASGYSSTDGNLNIPVSQLHDGIYFLRIAADGKAVTRKFSVVKSQ